MRQGGVYAKVDGSWHLSTQSWHGHTTMPWIELWRANDSARRVPADEVQAVTMVHPEVEYEGFWFLLGELTNSDGDVLWGEVEWATSDCFAYLLYLGEQWREVLTLPGVRHLDDRSSMGGEELTIRLSDITGYREKFEDISLESGPS